LPYRQPLVASAAGGRIIRLSAELLKLSSVNY
jgi:hypothetical protein